MTELEQGVFELTLLIDRVEFRFGLLSLIHQSDRLYRIYLCQWTNERLSLQI